ncbi:MAG TPA: TonB-dependent receptor, partial [Myxococcaceae bacterium]|nr:TonB-dependent receptor [Myxococcaceae bacterium]
ASDFILEREVLAAAPHRTASDLLGSAPGVYVSSPEGDAVAHEIYLRGFDAEHGQDVELTVGPVPINQPSHLHGQGYADLNFIIPETVRSLRVTEGVYDPRQGDFAVAGSIHFDLAVPERGTHVRSGFGSFGQYRQLLLWAPKDEAEETFGAFLFQRTQGFGQNRGSQVGSATGQLAFDGPAGFSGLLHVAAYGARANLAGVLRRDDVASGEVDFYGVYPNPSATAQSAAASRYQLAVTLERGTDEGARTHLSLWAMTANFRQRINFTGFLERSQYNPQWVGRGDLIEQSNQDFGLGARFFQRTRRARLAPWADARLELGLALRNDSIRQAQNLLQAPENETWDRRVDADINASDLGAYADADARLGPWVHLRGGVRADVLNYDLDDRISNTTPRFQQETQLPGYRRTALGVAAGPRASLEVEPRSWIRLLGSYGEGYRSPQGLGLSEGENAPFTKVRAMEAGVQLKPGGGEALSFTGAAYQTRLSEDLAFEPGEARLERIGPSRRRGVAMHLLARPAPWALASISATYVRAVLTAPPPATAENPTPSLAPGQLLPYVPPWVLRADAAVTRELTLWGDTHLDARLGGGATYLSSRPLPYGRFADTVFLLDLSASLRWRYVELTLDVYNALDRRYAATEYSFVSNWGNREAPSRVPARHFSAGPPRTFLASLALHF